MKNIIYIVFNLFILGQVYAEDKAEIVVYAPVLAPNDTLELYLQEERIGYAARNPYRLITATNEDGYFYFNISGLKKVNWIGLNISYQKSSGNLTPFLMHEFLLEPEDRIHVNLTPRRGKYRSVEDGYDGNIPIILEAWDAHFTGIGSVKYNVLWQIKQIEEAESRNKIWKSLQLEDPLNLVYQLKIIYDKSIEVLENHKTEMTPNAYNLLTAQVRGYFGVKMGRLLEGLYYASKEKDWANRIGDELDRYIETGKEDLNHFSEEYVLSPKYVEYLTQYTWVALLKATKTRDVELWYHFVKELMQPSILRDRVLASLLKERFQFKSSQSLLNDALATVKDSLAYAHVSLLQHALKGEQAFAFSLPDINGKYHKMDDFKGKVVFMDFWYAACTPCRKYMLNVVGPVKKHFKDNPDVVFITVSIDEKEMFSRLLKQAEFLPEGGIHLYTENKYAKHPIITHYQIMSYPYPLLVGKDGRLINEKATLSSQGELISAIDAGLKK